MTTYQMPVDGAEVVDLGHRTFRKQFLRRGHTIEYPDPAAEGGKRTLKFDDEYLSNVTRSFKAGAFDAVPFILADSDNRHNEDPTRVRAEVIGVEETPEGVDAILRFPNDESARLVEEYPRLGVSARLVENFVDADGRTHPVAFKHLLGTLDPRVARTGDWQEVLLSVQNDGEQVIDLTEAGAMADAIETDESVADELDAFWSGLTPEEQAEYTALAEAEMTAPTDPAPAPKPDPTPASPTAQEPAMASLSNEAQAQIDLANANAASALDKLHRVEWSRSRDNYLHAGVPVWALDLAEPVLADRSVTVDLASGTGADAGLVLTQILDKLKGTIDLSGTRGYGDDPESAGDASDQLVQQALRQSGYGAIADRTAKK